jgi:Cu2+-exporting ATPase
MPKCDHCLIDYAENRAVIDTINGRLMSFCCNGCRGVYRLIHDEGLDDFYCKRGDSWKEGPPDERFFEPDDFREFIKSNNDSSEIELTIDGIRCASCIWLIEKILMKTEGLTSARINYATHRAKIKWDSGKTDLGTILRRIHSAGYVAVPPSGNDQEIRFRAHQRDLLIRLGTAAFFSMQLMMYSVALYAGYFQGISDAMKTVLQIISWAVATPVLFYSGMPFIRGAFARLKKLSFDMDVLIASGSGAAYFYSIYQIFSGGEVFFDTSSMIITLILLGRYIETGAKGRASSAIAALMSLRPDNVRRVISAQTTEQVKLKSVNTGDILRVLPGETIPLDGIVSEGSSEVDESMLTGESMPVLKQPGAEVFGGTKNINGRLDFRVTRTGDMTVLAQIAKAVSDAQSRKASIQSFADRVAGYFVPAVLLLSLGTGLYWLMQNTPLTEAVMNAVSVMVIACPCALGLATPLAVLTGTLQSSSKGILIRGGDVIERAAVTTAVIFDKTGTLTEGRHRIVAYRGTGMPDQAALRIAASLEYYSEHTIADAFKNASEEQRLLPVEDFRIFPGRGLSGKVNGDDVIMGSRKFIEASSPAAADTIHDEQVAGWLDRYSKRGGTIVLMVVNKKLAAVFAITDSVRKEAAALVKLLNGKGLRTGLLTGDGKAAALHAAETAGIDTDNVISETDPAGKAEVIRKMQECGEKVAMVGDGINDSPALVQADTGIAMGRASDIAIDSADIILMRNDLMLTVEALLLSKKIIRIIRQNLLWAFAYNMVSLPLAVSGMLHPIFAALAMTMSSLSVVANSMRLRVDTDSFGVMKDQRRHDPKTH